MPLTPLELGSPHPTPVQVPLCFPQEAEAEHGYKEPKPSEAKVRVQTKRGSKLVGALTPPAPALPQGLAALTTEHCALSPLSTACSGLGPRLWALGTEQKQCLRDSCRGGPLREQGVPGAWAGESW